MKRLIFFAIALLKVKAEERDEWAPLLSQIESAITTVLSNEELTNEVVNIFNRNREQEQDRPSSATPSFLTLFEEGFALLQRGSLSAANADEGRPDLDLKALLNHFSRSLAEDHGKNGLTALPDTAGTVEQSIQSALKALNDSLNRRSEDVTADKTELFSPAANQLLSALNVLLDRKLAAESALSPESATSALAVATALEAELVPMANEDPKLFVGPILSIEALKSQLMPRALMLSELSGQVKLPNVEALSVSAGAFLSSLGLPLSAQPALTKLLASPASQTLDLLLAMSKTESTTEAAEVLGNALSPVYNAFSGMFGDHNPHTEQPAPLHGLHPAVVVVNGGLHANPPYHDAHVLHPGNSAAEHIGADAYSTSHVGHAGVLEQSHALANPLGHDTPFHHPSVATQGHDAGDMANEWGYAGPRLHYSPNGELDAYSHAHDRLHPSPMASADDWNTLHQPTRSDSGHSYHDDYHDVYQPGKQWTVAGAGGLGANSWHSDHLGQGYDVPLRHRCDTNPEAPWCQTAVTYPHTQTAQPMSLGSLQDAPHSSRLPAPQPSQISSGSPWHDADWNDHRLTSPHALSGRFQDDLADGESLNQLLATYILANLAIAQANAAACAPTAVPNVAPPMVAPAPAPAAVAAPVAAVAAPAAATPMIPSDGAATAAIAAPYTSTTTQASVPVNVQGIFYPNGIVFDCGHTDTCAGSAATGAGVAAAAAPAAPMTAAGAVAAGTPMAAGPQPTVAAPATAAALPMAPAAYPTYGPHIAPVPYAQAPAAAGTATSHLTDPDLDVGPEFPLSLSGTPQNDLPLGEALRDATFARRESILTRGIDRTDARHAVLAQREAAGVTPAVQAVAVPTGVLRGVLSSPIALVGRLLDRPRVAPVVAPTVVAPTTTTSGATAAVAPTAVVADPYMHRERAFAPLARLQARGGLLGGRTL